MKNRVYAVVLPVLCAALGSRDAKAATAALVLADQAVPHHHMPHHHAPAAAPEPPHHEHADHGPQGINWFDFSRTEQPPFAALALNFAILIAIYVAFGRRPIAAALASRRTKIAHAIEEAARIKHEAEERSKLYKAKLETLDEELGAARQALVESGKGERARLIREAEETAVRIRKDAERMIEQELEQMREDVTREIVEIATRTAAELLVQHVNATDQARIAQDYLNDLKRLPRSAKSPKAVS